MKEIYNINNTAVAIAKETGIKRGIVNSAIHKLIENNIVELYYVKNRVFENAEKFILMDDYEKIVKLVKAYAAQHKNDQSTEKSGKKKIWVRNIITNEVTEWPSQRSFVISVGKSPKAAVRDGQVINDTLLVYKTKPADNFNLYKYFNS